MSSSVAFYLSIMLESCALFSQDTQQGSSGMSPNAVFTRIRTGLSNILYIDALYYLDCFSRNERSLGHVLR